MNYLAHAFLSFKDEELLIGNLLADWVTNRELDLFSIEIQKGIHLHRAIDSFTDVHPATRACTKRMHRSFGKYSIVVIDIYFDYFLSKNWDMYCDVALEPFCENTYRFIKNQLTQIPEPYDQRFIRMIEVDWLQSASTLTGLANSFVRFNRRIQNPISPESYLQVLKENESFFDRQFHHLFPDVIQFAKDTVMQLQRS